MFDHSPHLVGRLHSPETAPGTKDTVQIHVAEQFTGQGATSFGLARVRGKLVWQVGGRHVLRFVREMPVGWPSGDHHERDEAAFTGRTGAVPWRSVAYFGVPYLSADRVKRLGAYVGLLEKVVDAMRQIATEAVA